MTMLEIKDLNVNYGYIRALKDVNINVEEGQIVSIIGANGAGKTSLLRAISGLVKATSGKIFFQGEPLPGKANAIVKRGIVHVPEGRQTFSGLTIRDNLLTGGFLFPNHVNEENVQKMYEYFPILKEREHQHAGTLSGGEQQMLAVARGLMAHPKILLLDEPSMGLAPLIVGQIFRLIQTIRDSGITVLLIEQNAQRALTIADYAYVLENGEITLEGTGNELLNSEDVKKAYLGA